MFCWTSWSLTNHPTTTSPNISTVTKWRLSVRPNRLELPRPRHGSWNAHVSPSPVSVKSSWLKRCVVGRTGWREVTQLGHGKLQKPWTFEGTKSLRLNNRISRVVEPNHQRSMYPQLDWSISTSRSFFSVESENAPSSQSAWMFYNFSPHQNGGFLTHLLDLYVWGNFARRSFKKKTPKNQDFLEILGMGQINPIRWQIDILCGCFAEKEEQIPISLLVCRIFPLMIDWPSRTRRP